MRVAGAAIVIGLLVLAVVGGGAVRARQRASSAVRHQAEPLLVDADTLYSSLANADATATNTFLEAGLEPPARRQAYLSDLATAAAQLTAVAEQAGTSPEVTRALGVINKDLPLYSGMVEASRADNLLGYPVGAAYLNEASTMMETAILPAAGQLYQVEAQRLNAEYHSGQSLLDVFGVLLVAVLALALLALTQRFLTQRTNRIVNPFLLLGTILTVVLVVWTVVAFTVSASRLDAARRRGSDPIQLLSSAQILVARAQVDENLALVARGSGTQYLADFQAVTGALGAADGSSGLVKELEPFDADFVGTNSIDTFYAAYLKAHQAVVAAENSAQFTTAVTLATGEGTGDELPAASDLTSVLGNEIQAAQTTFNTKAAAAAHNLAILELGVLALALVAAGLALAGLEQRISEYR